MNDREAENHRRAFEDLPDYHHESAEHGMLPPTSLGDLPQWEPPDGDVILRRVPDFEQGLDFSDRLMHRVQTNVRWSVVAHSPDGFEWSSGGSGPADLSLNILNMFCPPATDGREPIPCYEGEASATA